MNKQSNWQPSISIDNLLKRAKILSKIRRFFSINGVLEVETPIISRKTTTDIHLVPFSTKFIDNSLNEEEFWLITSPEYHMKRLLALGSGPIYQIGHSFRNKEIGRYHNPEFTMLEWYRPKCDMFCLMDEVDNLLQFILGCNGADFISYQNIFIDHLNLDPLSTNKNQLLEAASKLGNSHLITPEKDIDSILMILFMIGIEPNIGQKKPCFVYNFPANQAILSEINSADSRISERFEVYYKGIELANGCLELTDFQEHINRFEEDNRKRINSELPIYPINDMLLDAIKHGMPVCSGVALGIDRLVMLSLNANSIHEVITFPIDRC
ncbi:elongation factor P lysine(34) lysyltransferase [Candidatus Pantoea edessiphila]|uniref:Elongation factor P lysine(34) lysyltransferase n=1 Tax=Candidatus Pantoea edessiphila TaxID=2044610 RepID=A0A2P5T007_9GAMM|nr:elongation factor P--(R)-beta-lysine ligase [Candidatus Pantoea edessiphila]PPI87911.1 elongation factor P lysine(34) lysyltransferase [Candidatus Pantoea edessiphila]